MRLFIVLVALLSATLTYAQDNIILRNGEEIPARVLEVTQAELKYRKTANPDGPIYTSSLRDVLLIKYANGTKDTFGADRPTLRNQAERRERPALEPIDRRALRPAPGVGLNGLRYRRGLFSRYYVGGNGEQISLSAANSLFYNAPEAMNAYERGRSLRTWSTITGISAVALVGVGAGLAIGNGGRRDHRDNMMGLNGPFGRGQHMGRAGGALAGGGLLLGLTSLWLDHRATVQFRRAADRFNNRQPASLRFAPGQNGVGAVLTY
ncbi:hypothetical protein [Fibrivirga algicola]|uniref:DUF5683 domain-containing protein n=1 Tax=Fibrivirga algicola TaxID=2950420 RepID=A0ABX0QGD6_9BACT|nr:hypothetical protein [Fibrivirga algicola]NID10281.1 hypothetical protein [Fibrivirga algicola]